MFDRSWSGICQEARLLGVKRSGRFWTEFEREFLKENFDKLSKEELVQHYGKKWKAIKSEASLLGLTRGEAGLKAIAEGNIKKRKYTCNFNFFKTWSSDMAYIFGLWVADGTIIEDNHRICRFSIGLRLSDAALLERLRNIMSSTQELIRAANGGEGIAILRVNSEEICKDIIALGGMPRKSLVIPFPSIPPEFMKDFLRGFYDGDGFISITNKKRNAGYVYRYVDVGVAGGLDFINTCKNTVCDLLGIDTQIIFNYQNGRPVPICELRYHGSKALRFLDYIYKDANLYLQRKYDKYLEYIVWRKKYELMKGVKSSLLNKATAL